MATVEFETAASGIPPEYLPLIASQQYEQYSEQDHLTWKTLCENSFPFWRAHAHPDFVEGLEKTCIDLDRIPKITRIDECLQRFGWGAVCVSGFIPPRAFMGLQAYGYLPIAGEIRKPENLGYTPAPDIFHEAAAHVPLLINPVYGQFLRRFGQLALKAGFSDGDQRRYDAIRHLSDIKEKPDTPPEEITRAEERLKTVCAEMTETSVGQQLTRFYWWTVEYGLIGDLDNPLMFGAGLLSSISESRDALKPEIKKLPLTLECIDQDFDITKPQPQLFVTPSYEHVFELLEAFEAKVAS